jgi:hypothetical protein
MYIGISKDNTVSNVRTLGSSDIVGTNSEFDVKYEFNSGDYYNTEKQFDSLSFFDYSSVKVSSPNFESWDGGSTYDLNKLIDRSTSTYMHTKKGKAINANNPLTIIFDLGRIYYFDYIYFVKKSPNNYAPKTIMISTSDDGENFVEQEEVTTEVSGDLVEINLSKKLNSRYVKMHITKTTSPSPGYIALISVEFIEKGVSYALKKPEFAKIGYYKGEENNVQINFDNFPYFGHSYMLQKDTFIEFNIENTTGIRIKTCHKTSAKIEAIITQEGNEIKKETITINENSEEDFPVIETGLTRGNYDFKFNIVEGSFDLEYILYEN